jgi:hypothetical protein
MGEIMERKLYMEFRLYVNPDANQETLHEMAKEFQEGIHDMWNFGDSPIKVNDITYEIVMEISHKNEDK